MQLLLSLIEYSTCLVVKLSLQNTHTEVSFRIIIIPYKEISSQCISVAKRVEPEICEIIPRTVKA